MMSWFRSRSQAIGYLQSRIDKKKDQLMILLKEIRELEEQLKYNQEEARRGSV